MTSVGPGVDQAASGHLHGLTSLRAQESVASHLTHAVK